MIAVQQPDVRAEPLGPVAVDEPEGDGRADERDRHRQEDQRLRDRLAAPEPVGERREQQARCVTATSGTRMIQTAVLRIDRSMLRR